MPRGGLPFIKLKFQKTLVIAERYFCRKTEVSHLREIAVKKITYGLVNFKYIKYYFAEVVEESELKPYSIISDDVLHGIIELYIKVRSFQKHVQRHRCLKEGTNKKASRTELISKNTIFTRKTMC